MPRLRRCGGTKLPAATSTTVRSAMVMRPASAFSRPATQRSVVVLPQPDGPSSVTTSPAPTSKSMPSTAATTSLFAANVFVSPSTRIMARAASSYPLPLRERVPQRSKAQRGRVRGSLHNAFLKYFESTPHPARFARHPLPQGERVRGVCRAIYRSTRASKLLLHAVAAPDQIDDGAERHQHEKHQHAKGAE